MAMTTQGLKSAIIGSMLAEGFLPNHPDTDGQADKYIEALASAIVGYIKNSAEVVDTGTQSTPAGNWPII